MGLKPLIRSMRRRDFLLRQMSKKRVGLIFADDFLLGLELGSRRHPRSGQAGKVVRCPSPPGAPVRTMTVREQLESLAAHNAYHFGRIVLMRQIAGAWPPASGGDTC